MKILATLFMLASTLVAQRHCREEYITVSRYNPVLHRSEVICVVRMNTPPVRVVPPCVVHARPIRVCNVPHSNIRVTVMRTR